MERGREGRREGRKSSERVFLLVLGCRIYFLIYVAFSFQCDGLVCCGWKSVPSSKFLSCSCSVSLALGLGLGLRLGLGELRGRRGEERREGGNMAVR